MKAEEAFTAIWGSFIERIRDLRARDKKKYTVEKIADMCGVGKGTVSRWLQDEGGELTPFPAMLRYLQAVGLAWPTFDQDGMPSVEPDRDKPVSRDICFVNAGVVPAGEGQEPPVMEDYLAVPLVEEVGAGPGLIPQGELLSWFLVWRHQRAIAHKRDLIAVQIGKHSTSMTPTLSPLDIVLVDRQDWDVTWPGHIMLVTDPDGAGKIKRVAVERLEEQRDYRITYYSDNAASNPPEVWSLNRDFEGDLRKAVVGRVVWAWSDVSNK